MSGQDATRADRRPLWVFIVGVVLTIALAWAVQSVSQSGAFALVMLLGVAGSAGVAFAVKYLPGR